VGRDNQVDNTFLGLIAVNDAKVSDSDSAASLPLSDHYFRTWVGVGIFGQLGQALFDLLF
jgi:hypothetical protein